jgi:hypothetical protein
MMTNELVSKLIKDNLVIEITEDGVIISTNQINSIKFDSINDITDDTIYKLLEKQ